MCDDVSAFPAWVLHTLISSAYAFIPGDGGFVYNLRAVEYFHELPNDTNKINELLDVTLEELKAFFFY